MELVSGGPPLGVLLSTGPTPSSVNADSNLNPDGKNIIGYKNKNHKRVEIIATGYIFLLYYYTPGLFSSSARCLEGENNNNLRN